MVRRVVEQGWTLAAAAEAAGVSVRTCSKWLGALPRRGRGGVVGSLLGAAFDPSSHPAEQRVEAIVALRRLRMTAAEIAECLGMPLSTVSARPDPDRAGQALAGSSRPSRRIATSAHGRASCCTSTSRSSGRIRRPAGHRVPGTPRAVRAKNDAAATTGTSGWEFVHVCVDDATRLAYVEVLGDEKATTAVGFLRRAMASTAATASLPSA